MAIITKQQVITIGTDGFVRVIRRSGLFEDGAPITAWDEEETVTTERWLPETRTPDEYDVRIRLTTNGGKAVVTNNGEWVSGEVGGLSASFTTTRDEWATVTTLSEQNNIEISVRRKLNHLDLISGTITLRNIIRGVARTFEPDDIQMT